MTEPTTVRDALERFLSINGFTMEAYDAPKVAIPFGPFTIHLPNSEGRKAIVRLHDIHHVVTNYGTDLAGEAEIGAWELRAGCTNLAGYVYNLMAVTLGVFIAPLRTLRAFLDGRGAMTLYRLGVPYDELLTMTVAELRERLSIPADGAAHEPARLNAAAPAS
ncbi:MAG: hypothetical protein H6719_13510 [Sandaracinaceae bacterium]|nr:hypothetical protein [Sandaracinaceae bacterium]